MHHSPDLPDAARSGCSKIFGGHSCEEITVAYKRNDMVKETYRPKWQELPCVK